MILNHQCYDLRFPELSLVLAQQGADILTFPSAFTVTTGMAHWEVSELLIYNTVGEDIIKKQALLIKYTPPPYKESSVSGSLI